MDLFGFWSLSMHCFGLYFTAWLEIQASNNSMQQCSWSSNVYGLKALCKNIQALMLQRSNSIQQFPYSRVHPRPQDVYTIFLWKRYFHILRHIFQDFSRCHKEPLGRTMKVSLTYFGKNQEIYWLDILGKLEREIHVEPLSVNQILILVFHKNLS